MIAWSRLNPKPQSDDTPKQNIASHCEAIFFEKLSTMGALPFRKLRNWLVPSRNGRMPEWVPVRAFWLCAALLIAASKRR